MSGTGYCVWLTGLPAAGKTTLARALGQALELRITTEGHTVQQCAGQVLAHLFAPAALYLGRWAPFHAGHKAIIDQALAAGERVMVGVRPTSPRADRWPAEQRADFVRAAYHGDPRVTVFVLPLDLGSVCIGREVGYAVRKVEVPDGVEEISGTRLREMIRAGIPGWERDLPAGTAQAIRVAEKRNRGNADARF